VVGADKDKQKDWMAALISITTGNLSQASPMITPIMAKCKLLGVGLSLVRPSKHQSQNIGARSNGRFRAAKYTSNDMKRRAS